MPRVITFGFGAELRDKGAVNLPMFFLFFSFCGKAKLLPLRTIYGGHEKKVPKFFGIEVAEKETAFSL